LEPAIIGYDLDMARPVWTGSINFGLVNVPVKAHTAVRDHDIHFNQLEKKSGSRIRNRKVSEKSGKEVDADDIEMGFEIRKGRYVTFDKKELEELRPASTRMIEVSDFVALDEIDPIYYERTYWLAPGDDAAKKAYDILLSAMEERGRVAIGTVVMRNKQYLTAVRPLDGVLAMSTMRFADEIVPRADVDGLPSRRAKPDTRALKMATQLLDSLASDWDPARYHDTYVEELRKRIKARDKGKEIVEKDEPVAEGKVLDLMAALERSVEAAKGRKTARKSTTAKKRTTKARKSA
jgi:DNA end-binding protein Ku